MSERTPKQAEFYKRWIAALRSNKYKRAEEAYVVALGEEGEGLEFCAIGLGAYIAMGAPVGNWARMYGGVGVEDDPDKIRLIPRRIPDGTPGWMRAEDILHDEEMAATATVGLNLYRHLVCAASGLQEFQVAHVETLNDEGSRFEDVASFLEKAEDWEANRWALAVDPD